MYVFGQYKSVLILVVVCSYGIKLSSRSSLGGLFCFVASLLDRYLNKVVLLDLYKHLIFLCSYILFIF